MKKKLISIVVFVVLIILLFMSGFTFAKYYTSIESGNLSANIARWSLGLENTETEIKLSNNKIAPGSNGTFQIEVNGEGSEVDVEYEILVSHIENIPENMKYSAEVRIEDENNNQKLISTVEEKDSIYDLVSELNGTISAIEKIQKRIIVVYWDWPFEDEDNGLTDTKNGTLSYDDNGKTSLDCIFNLEIIGKQAQSN